MGTLTGCLTKAKGVIHIDDQRSILARSQELRAGGMDTIAAAAQAVAEQRTAVQGLLAPAEKKFDTLNQTLPSRVPTSKKTTPDLSMIGVPDIATLSTNPAQFEKAVNAVMSDPGMKGPNMRFRSVQAKADYLIGRMVDNLLWLHDQMPKPIRNRARLWYDGASRIAEGWATKWGKTKAQTAGMLAVLSPQKDWFMNTTMAERVGDILSTKGNHVWDDKMDAAAFKFLLGDVAKTDPDSAKNTAAYEKARGKTLDQVVDMGNPRVSGVWIRAYDEAYHSASHSVITPEGGFAGPKITAQGEEARRAWGDFSAIGKAASIFNDGSAKNISANLGSEHKVRNFYNNIFNPADPRFTTIDTHAVAAAQLRPLAGADKAVAENFGKTGGDNLTGISGSYPLYYEAYKRAAEARGILPREMQSITWEAVRGLFTEGFKNKTNKAAIDSIWKKFSSGKISLDDARSQIHDLAGDITEPDWWQGEDAHLTEALNDKSYSQERGPVAGNRITFEVAPDPNDTALKSKWDALSSKDKAETSHRIAWNIAAKAMANLFQQGEKFDPTKIVKGELHQQLGGYGPDSNPSMSIWLDPNVSGPKAVKLANLLGYALRQESMGLTSPKSFPGATKMVALAVDLGEDASKAHEVYTTLRQITDAKGEPYVTGHTTADGRMVILFDEKSAGITVDELGELASQKTNRKYNITSDDLFVSWIGDGGYDVSGTQTTSGSGTEPSVRSYADQLRDEAARQLEESISGRRKAPTGELLQRREFYAADTGRIEAYGEVTRNPDGTFGWNDPRTGDRLSFQTEDEARNSLSLAAAKFNNLEQTAFYSALERGVTQLNINAAPAQGWLQAIKGLVAKGQVKQAEIESVGLPEFLQLQEGKVTKQQVVDFLKNNGVQIQEVVLADRTQPSAELLNWVIRRRMSEPTTIGEWVEVSNRLLSEAQSQQQRGATVTAHHLFGLSEEAERIGEGLDENGSTSGQAKYSSYTLPGGENYREVLLTLPTEAQDTGVDVTEDGVTTQPKPLPKFVSGHWDQPNVVAHLRLNDRLDAEGNRVLFVEEIQSDWGQEGKKKGFLQKDKPTVVVKEAPTFKGFWTSFIVRNGVEEQVGSQWSSRADAQRAGEQLAAEQGMAMGAIPSAPFVTKTEAWLNLALKRVIKMAVDGGYDKVAFVTGEQSAERYDLSKQVDRIDYTKNGDGTFNMSAIKGGTEVFSKEDLTESEVADTVGKEIAAKMASGEGKPSTELDEVDRWEDDDSPHNAKDFDYDNTKPKSLSGLDLKVGGEGMKTFYDKIVPNAVKDLLKKLGGDGLTTVVIKSQNKTSDVGYDLSKMADINIEQPGFSITDKMRDIVAGGLPLFQGGETLGSFHPQSLTITLQKKANLTTLHHEMSHFFFEVMFDIASQENAPAGIVADATTVLKWFGVKDMDTWKSMTLDEQRPYHERWAESYEQYLMEGKAPSVELQPLFWRFKAWMLEIYKSAAGILGQSKGDTKIQLSDEVRQVYDRLLASDDQIRQAEEVAGMMPDEAATNTAIDKLAAQSLKNMKWLSGAMSKKLRALQRQAAGFRRDIRIAVMAEVDAMPVFQAKAELEAAQAEFELHPTSAEFNAQVIAEKHGFSSIDHMYRAIEQAGSKIDMVKNMTDARMLEQHGELLDPQSLQDAVNLAIHNEAREKVIAAELKAEMEALSATTETGQVNKAGRKITVNALAKAARLFAATIVNRAKIGELQKLSNNHTMAERRAAKRYYTVKDTKDRIQAKQDQMLNNSASKALLEAQTQVDKAVKYLKKFDNEGTRQGLHIDYLDQIDKLLERVDLRKSTSGAEIERRQKLAAWIKSQEDIGISPELPDYLLEDVQLTSYKQMTVEQFNGLVDSVRMIEHLGRLKNKLLTAKDNRDFQAIKESMIESILKYAGDREAMASTPRPGIESGIQGVKDFGAIHIKAATFARILDGGQDGGQVWEYLIRPANVSATNEVTWRSEATEALTKIIGPWITRNRGGRIGDFIKSVYDSGKFYPSIKTSLTRTEVLVMALNIGNEGNLQRLLGGKGWTVDQIRPVLDTLTAEDWKTVQGVWDYLESRVGGISEMERRVFGKNLAKVEIGSTLAEQYGLKGGYYPISYDPVASIRSQEHADAEGARAEMRGAYGAAQVRKGFTKPRAEEVTGRPLLLDLSGLFNGVNDQIHYQAWTEWLIDANRLLRSQSLDSSMRDHYGPALVSQLKSWRTDIANGNRDYNIAGSQAASFIRHGISMAGLGFNVMSGASQIIGFNQSFDRVGARWMGTGIKQYMSNPVKATAHVKSMSEFMAGRTRTMFRELNELRNQVEGQTKLREFVAEYGYWIMAQMQQTVDVPTWIGAYEKAMSEGNVEERSIRLADQAVIDAQGSGLLSDLSAIERGNAWKKLFTTFYSFMNTALNLGVADVYTSEASLKGRAKVSAQMLLLYTVPAVLGVLMKAALTPGDSGDDDPEKLLRKLASAQIEYLMGLMVFIREFRDLANVMTGADSPRAYQGPGGTRIIGDVGKAAIQAKQGEFDTAFRKSFVNVIGDLFGLPSAQINRMWTGAEALQEGKTENPAALIMGYQEP